jgi:hypothetical protein
MGTALRAGCQARYAPPAPAPHNAAARARPRSVVRRDGGGAADAGAGPGRGVPQARYAPAEPEPHSAARRTRPRSPPDGGAVEPATGATATAGGVRSVARSTGTGRARGRRAGCPRGPGTRRAAVCRGRGRRNAAEESARSRTSIRPARVARGSRAAGPAAPEDDGAGGPAGNSVTSSSSHVMSAAGEGAADKEKRRQRGTAKPRFPTPPDGRVTEPLRGPPARVGDPGYRSVTSRQAARSPA